MLASRGSSLTYAWHTGGGPPSPNALIGARSTVYTPDVSLGPNPNNRRKRLIFSQGGPSTTSGCCGCSWSSPASSIVMARINQVTSRSSYHNIVRRSRMQIEMAPKNPNMISSAIVESLSSTPNTGRTKNTPNKRNARYMVRARPDAQTTSLRSFGFGYQFALFISALPVSTPRVHSIPRHLQLFTINKH